MNAWRGLATTVLIATLLLSVAGCSGESGEVGAEPGAASDADSSDTRSQVGTPSANVVSPSEWPASGDATAGVSPSSPGGVEVVFEVVASGSDEEMASDGLAGQVEMAMGQMLRLGIPYEHMRTTSRRVASVGGVFQAKLRLHVFASDPEQAAEVVEAGKRAGATQVTGP